MLAIIMIAIAPPVIVKVITVLPFTTNWRYFHVARVSQMIYLFGCYEVTH